MKKKVYVIDGNNFNDLQGFFQEIHDVLTPNSFVVRSLDGFNDVIRGGFGGTPAEGFRLIWKNSTRSRECLGYEYTAAYRQEGIDYLRDGLSDEQMFERDYDRFKRSFPEKDEAFHLQHLQGFKSAYAEMQHKVAQNLRGEGETLFDILLHYILDHPQIDLSLQ